MLSKAFITEGCDCCGMQEAGCPWPPMQTRPCFAALATATMVHAPSTEPNTVAAWDLEGRKVALAWWGGYGIGANDWREADVVIAFEDYQLPTRTVIATVQGLKGHMATQGALATLADTGKVKHEDVEALALGNVYRWLKQMALRGRAREFDQEGVCQPQKLVVVSQNLARLATNIHKLFPGANFRSEAARDRKATLVDQVLRVLMNTTADELTTTQVGEAIDREWRKVSQDVLNHPTWSSSLANIGWRLDRGKPSVFRRTVGPLVGS